MNSILRKAMLPAAVATAMFGLIGAFGSGSVPSAYAAEGDICAVSTDAPAAGATYDEPVDYVVAKGETYGLVFRVEDSVGENVEVRIDSETGSGRITSKAEFANANEFDDENDDEPSYGNFYDPDIAHLLVQPPVGTQVVDTFEPFDFNSADGQPLDGINDWLVDVGYTAFATDNWSPCDSGDFIDDVDDLDGCDLDEDDEVIFPDECDEIDGWGFIDFECIEAGYFHIDILTPDDTEETGATKKFYCAGEAEAAEIAATPTTVEIVPVGSSVSASTIRVTVTDQFGDRLDGVAVTLSTDNCTFKVEGDSDISPAGGGTTVDVETDTDDSTFDNNFLINNPLEHNAGTAEAILDCAKGTPGAANVMAVVEREGSDIVLEVVVTVIGQTAANGLSLELTPDDIECGETILATATALDSEGATVSDGTTIYFTTDTSTGIQGGEEGAQGSALTVDGDASVLIATDPSNNGTHTVIAFTLNAAGTPNAQASKTYVCDGAVAPAAPTVPVNPPNTGTGTGSITPPNTGDAGLAAGSSSSSLFVIVGAVAFVLAGLASVRFARND